MSRRLFAVLIGKLAGKNSVLHFLLEKDTMKVEAIACILDKLGHKAIMDLWIDYLRIAG